MVVVCVDNTARIGENHLCHLTLGRMYQIQEHSGMPNMTRVRIVDDVRQSLWYDFNRFKDVVAIREEKLSKILDEDCLCS